MPVPTATTTPSVESHYFMSVCQCKDQGIKRDTGSAPSTCSSSTFMDITIAFDLIATNSATSDTSAYTKQWQQFCQSSDWVTIYIPPPQHFLLSSVQRDALLSNADSIRQLSISNADSILSESSCTNITHLTCRGSLPSDGDNDNHYMNDELLEHSSLDLICQNPGLQSISLVHAESVLPHWTPQHLKSFINLSHLQLFSMDFSSIVATPDPIKTILSYCPNSVQELHLTNRRGHFRAPTSSFRLLHQPNFPRGRRPSSPAPSWVSSKNPHSRPPSPTPYTSSATAPAYPTSWKPFPNLRSLTFECHINSKQEDQILFPLLRHAPNLERLIINTFHHDLHHARLAVTLLTHCLQIKSLELFHLEFKEQELFRLVDTFVGMDRVALCITPEMNRRVVPALIANSGDSLQSVRLLERSFRHPCESVATTIVTTTSHSTVTITTATRTSTHTHVTQLLGRCPRLTTLEVQPDWGSFNSGISLKELVETEWASRQLETLILSISESGSFESESCCHGMQPEKEFECRHIATDTFDHRNSDSNSIDTSEDELEQGRRRQQQQRQIALWVMALSQKLKAQPRLKRVRLSWPSPACQMSFADASIYTSGELDQEFLYNTMGLLWQ